jgi:glycine C-acetyltransferase
MLNTARLVRGVGPATRSGFASSSVPNVARTFSCTGAALERVNVSSNPMYAPFHNELKGIREAGLYKNERLLQSPTGGHVRVGGKDLILMCANNYTGFASHPEIVKAAKAEIDTMGFGEASVRFICGTSERHKELEATIARFHGMEDAILYPSCFDANAGIFEALLTKEDAIISDTLNHASIIDGIRLSKAQRHLYQHMDLQDLEAKLIAAKDCRLRMIVTDGVFSMDGDVAPLKEIVALSKKYNALTFIDECHASGFFGKTGKGTDEFFGVRGQIDIINSTLGKGLGGGSGGYTAASQPIVDLLRQRSRPYLFSNSVPPAVVGASLKVFELLEKDTSFVERIRSLVHRYRKGLAAAGFTVKGHPDHPICPVMLGDAVLAAKFANKMLEKGVYVVAFSFPVVPKGQARIRTQVSASHTEADIDHVVKSFTEVGRELGVISK